MDEDTPIPTAIPLDNSGRGPLQVPGFHGIPIHYELKSENRFAHGEREWRQTPGVTAREQAMVDLMNKVTDKSGWYVDVFNNEIVGNWRKWAFETYHLMSEKAWSWCLEELREKAVYFNETKHVRVLDTGTCVCKSDTPDLQSLAISFKSAATPLLDQHRTNEGWQPTSEDPILNLVDPSLFPLVYGRSLVLAGGGYVDLQDIFDSYKDATVAPEHLDRRIESRIAQEQADQDRIFRVQRPIYEPNQEFSCWSSNYQWLPCDVEFLKNTGTEIRLTSYINNLHPAHKSLYQDIEKLIALSIPMWNDCIIQGHSGLKDPFNKGQLGPVPLRIITYGIEWENELPDWARAFNVPSNDRKRMYHEARQDLLRFSKLKEPTDEDKESLRRVQERMESLLDVAGKENMELPPSDSCLWQMAKDYLELPEYNIGLLTPFAAPENWTGQPWPHMLQKLNLSLHFKHPEPGTAFTYEDWRAGKGNNKGIIDIVRGQRLEYGGQIREPVVPDFQPYKINLQDTFRNHGLQVIVRIDSVELTPDNPVYRTGSWQLPGQLNEHIAAMAVFPYDVENITTPRFEFRQETHIDKRSYRYDEKKVTRGEKIYYDKRLERPLCRYGRRTLVEINALTQILGFPPLHLYQDHRKGLAFQSIGSVTAPQGRLIAFPNVMEHRLRQFKLVNPTITGHYRAVKLYLVDPHYRICSTRNVPPQQHDWWAQEITKNFFNKYTAMPQELIDEILQGTNEWPMGMREARHHRREMMKEHHWNDLARINSMPRYNF